MGEPQQNAPWVRLEEPNKHSFKIIGDACTDAYVYFLCIHCGADLSIDRDVAKVMFTLPTAHLTKEQHIAPCVKPFR